jgi:hypothetical protein
VAEPPEKNRAAEGPPMSADHFRKRAELFTACICVLGYTMIVTLCAVAVNLPQVQADGAVWLTSIGSAALALGAAFLRRSVRLTRELEQENLDEIYQLPPWEETKAQLAELHNLHRRN